MGLRAGEAGGMGPSLFQVGRVLWPGAAGREANKWVEADGMAAVRLGFTHRSGPRSPPPRDTVSTMTDVPYHPHDIARRLDAARQDLLELSTRNRLLSTPRHAKRARALEVVDEKSDELYRLLVEGHASLTFLEASDEALAEQAEKEPPPKPGQRGGQREGRSPSTTGTRGPPRWNRAVRGRDCAGPTPTPSPKPGPTRRPPPCWSSPRSRRRPSRVRSWTPTEVQKHHRDLKLQTDLKFGGPAEASAADLLRRPFVRAGAGGQHAVPGPGLSEVVRRRHDTEGPVRAAGAGAGHAVAEERPYAVLHRVERGRGVDQPVAAGEAEGRLRPGAAGPGDRSGDRRTRRGRRTTASDSDGTVGEARAFRPSDYFARRCGTCCAT